MQVFSWRPDPLEEGTDELVQEWSSFVGFANPPWCLIAKNTGTRSKSSDLSPSEHGLIEMLDVIRWMWDAKKVTSYLKSKGCNDGLSLKRLNLKLRSYASGSGASREVFRPS